MTDNLTKAWTTVDKECKTARLIVPGLYTLDVDLASDGTVFFAYLDFYGGEHNINRNQTIELYTTLQSTNFEDALYESLKWAKSEMLEYSHIITTIKNDINKKLQQLI